MKKRRLEVDFAYDFELTGLISSVRGYKLAWEINHALGVNLARKDDLKMTTKEGEFFFTFFSHQSAVNTVNLFRNRSNEGPAASASGFENKGIFLVPEHSHLDYILYSKGDEEMHSKRLQEVLRNIPSIELVASLPLAALKSKDNFIF
ncbi:MAG TPA: IPExxxVDY family protein [Cyclobacteriaceae bacterium]|nr:IPExxxVDY family protein [Cyclobacteriaceae bacterium]